MDIDLELYRVFKEVALAGNISRAAERLFVSQSATSQAILQLEKRIGGKLFNRSVHGVELTVEGKTLFSYVNDALSLIENGENEFSRMKDLETGSIRIGASDTICSMFLLPILESFHNNYPEIRISVTNRVTSESISLLKHRQVDIAFVNLPIEDDETLQVLPVKTIHDCFVVGGRYMYLADTPFNLNELKNYPILMLETASNSRNQMDRLLQSKGLEIVPAIELGSLALLAEFAKIGLGIAATIKEEVEDMLAEGALRELKIIEELPERYIGLVKIKNNNLSFATKAFIKEIEEIPNKLP